MNGPVAIAGAGIAGLTAAIALLRRGIDVVVYEQAAELRQIGAGLQIGPNGARVLLDLGLGDDLAPVVTEAAGKEVRHWQSGQTWPLFDLGADCIARFGAPYWMVHRGDLHRVLMQAMLGLKPDGLRLDAAVTGFAQDADGVDVHIGDGAGVERAGVLIGGDGVHSHVRRAMGHLDRPQFTGIMAWRGLARAEGLPAELQRPVGVNWVGPGGHVITYPVRGGAMFNFVGIVEGRDWPVESWTEMGTFEECLADFAGWHPAVLATIGNLDQPFKWALIGRDPLNEWCEGRVCLMGDACHPTLPFLAQGANMAIEDGLVLARCLAMAGADAAAGLRRFQALRAERTSAIVVRSREMATRFHNPVLADPVAGAAYITDEWASDRVRLRYDWLYEYDARTVDVRP